MIPAMNNYVDKKGRMYCGTHRREVCHVCCVDHRPTNEIAMAEGDVDAHAVYQRQDKIMHAEHAAMVQQHANEGGEGPVVLGGEHSQRLFNVAASSPGQRSCANCGIRSDKLLKCARCKAAWYCSKDCQKAQYPAHKSICKATVAGAATSSSTATQGNEKLISWKQLRNLGGQAAEDRVLKVRIMDNPLPFLRCTFQGQLHVMEGVRFRPGSPSVVVA